MRAGWLQSLQRRLELFAGFLTGAERFSLWVNEESDNSWWNFKNLSIQVGIKGVEKDQANEIGQLLTRHEVGHVRFTSRNIDTKSLPFPFSLLNIVEDARIEHKMETDFSPLHRHSYQRHYLESDQGDSVFNNPYNIGILLRWQRSGVETAPCKPPELSEEEYIEFLSDWELCLTKSIESLSTYQVMEQVELLYAKWKPLFDAYKSEEGASGSVEKDADDMTGEGKEVQEQSSGQHSSSVADAKKRALYFKEQWFHFDMNYIRTQAEILRKLLDVKVKTEKAYAMSGRRFDVRRIENPPLAPFKRLMESRAEFVLKRMLIEIDGSGSMYGEDDTKGIRQPFEAACYIAYILSLVFPVDIQITTSESDNPIDIPLNQIDLLQSFTAWGGSENYSSVGKKPAKYSFTLFLTDACICDDDKKFVQTVLTKIAKVGAGYVGSGQHRLSETFPRYFSSNSLDQNIARMIALFLKRYFTRQFSA